MRIAYICADRGIPVYGRKGGSIHVQEVIRSMIRRGATVDLFAARVGGGTPNDLGAVRLHELPDIGLPNSSTTDDQLLQANALLDEQLEHSGPYDFVYERYSLWSFAGMEHAKALGVPALLEVNAPLIDEQERYRSLGSRNLAERAAYRTFGAASDVIAVSKEVAVYADNLVNHGAGVHVVANGVDPHRFAADQKASIKNENGDFTVGFVGTLKPWHGLSVLIDAFDRLHQTRANSRLLIVGDGPEQDDLVRDLQERGLQDASVLTGAVGHDEISGLLASMDVATAPYPAGLTFYFSPLKVYEYLAAGVPVVASALGQLSDVIDHEQTGLLCRPGCSESLASALLRLEGDQCLRSRLGQAGRAQVLENNTWDAVAGKIFQIAASRSRKTSFAGQVPAVDQIAAVRFAAGIEP